MTRCTTRLLRLACPRCGTDLQVYVRGLGPVITAEEWLEQVDDETRAYLHAAHTDVTLVNAPTQRARTRRFT